MKLVKRKKRGAKASNFKGNWSNLTGMINMPSSVLHEGEFYEKTINIKVEK